MSIAQVKQELGLTRQELADMEINGFWDWHEENEERECPVCKVSMTGEEPWLAHLDGKHESFFYRKCNLMIRKIRVPVSTHKMRAYEPELKIIFKVESTATI